MKRNKIKITALLAVIVLLSTVLCGCMEAGSADWVGARPEKTEEKEEEPSEEETATETVGEVEGGDKEIENEMPTYVFEEEPEEEEEEEEPEEEEEEEEPEEVVSDETVSEDIVEVDEGDNHDVTKGTWDGDDWYATATIGEGYSIEVSVTATRSSMQQEHVTDYSAAGDKMGSKIDDARFSYFKKYEEGDKDAAADDVEEYKDIDEMHSNQKDAIMALSDHIGKLIAQFGITSYDFDHPAENDDDGIIVLDLYRKSSFRYLMTVTFEDENSSKITSIDFELDE